MYSVSFLQILYMLRLQELQMFLGWFLDSRQNDGQTVSFIFISIVGEIVLKFLDNSPKTTRQTARTYTLYVYTKLEDFADFHRTFFADFSSTCPEFHIFILPIFAIPNAVQISKTT